MGHFTILMVETTAAPKVLRMWSHSRFKKKKKNLQQTTKQERKRTSVYRL